jgi:hypothetical protein
MEVVVVVGKFRELHQPRCMPYPLPKSVDGPLCLLTASLGVSEGDPLSALVMEGRFSLLAVVQAAHLVAIGHEAPFQSAFFVCCS